MLWSTDRGAYCHILPSAPGTNRLFEIVDPPVMDWDPMRAKTTCIEIDLDKFKAYMDTVLDTAEDMKVFKNRARILTSNPVEPLFWNFASSSGDHTAISCWDGILGQLRFRVIKVSSRNSFKSNIYKEVRNTACFGIAQDTQEGKNLLMRLRLMF